MANEAVKETLNKEAELNKEAAEITESFASGMDKFLAENNIDKETFAKVAGVETKNLTGAAMAWLADQYRAQNAK